MLYIKTTKTIKLQEQVGRNDEDMEQEKDMASLKDISKICGVSVATVSKALNDHKDIGEETKATIRRVAKEMGYSPNLSARALKTNRTYGIGSPLCR